MTLVALLVVLTASRGEAQQRRSYTCPKAQTQSDLNACADAVYKAADLQMKRAYAALTQGLADATRRRALVAAQRAWVAFRDSYCHFVAGPLESGSVYPMQLGFCLAGVTEERTKQLRGDLLNERL
jgi:uncharacterized protein YecT (DUF1311 family)